MFLLPTSYRLWLGFGFTLPLILYTKADTATVSVFVVVSGS